MENKKGAEGLSGFVPLVLFRFCVPGAAALQEKQSDQKSSQQAHYGGKYLFSAGGRRSVPQAQATSQYRSVPLPSPDPFSRLQDSVR